VVSHAEDPQDERGIGNPPVQALSSRCVVDAGSTPVRDRPSRWRTRLVAGEQDVRARHALGFAHADERGDHPAGPATVDQAGTELGEVVAHRVLQDETAGLLTRALTKRATSWLTTNRRRAMVLGGLVARSSGSRDTPQAGMTGPYFANGKPSRAQTSAALDLTKLLQSHEVSASLSVV
jgi:hypothetical protein